MSEWVELGLLGLFLASFLAATVVPFSSELLFSALIAAGFHPWACIGVATAGNWLGGMTCYYLGHLGKIEWIEKYLKVKKEKIDNLLSYVQKYGEWLAFFSFLPMVGDLIAVATGYFRCSWWKVALIMLVGKFFRYLIWLGAFNQVVSWL